MDVGDDASVRQAIQHVHSTAGRIDIVVNNAGYVLSGAIEETSDAEAHALFNTNVFGVSRVTRAVLPIMREQRRGRIVKLGSVVGLLPVRSWAGIPPQSTRWKA